MSWHCTDTELAHRLTNFIWAWRLGATDSFLSRTSPLLPEALVFAGAESNGHSLHWIRATLQRSNITLFLY